MHPAEIFYIVLSVSVIVIGVTIIIVGGAILLLIFEIRKVLQLITFTIQEIITLKNNFPSGKIRDIFGFLFTRHDKKTKT